MRKSFDLVILILVMCLFGVFIAMIPKDTSKDVPSSHSAKPHGLKALYLVLSRSGTNVGRVEGSLYGLTGSGNVAIVGDSSVISTTDDNSVVDWLNRGNTLIMVPSADHRWLNDKLDVYLMDAKNEGDYTVAPRKSSYTDGVGKVSFTASMSIAEGSGMDAIAGAKDDVIVAEKQVGSGRLVVFADPLMIENSGIRQADNVVLATNIVAHNVRPGGKVRFIEPPQRGVSESGPSVGRTIGRGGRLALIELGLVLLLVLISFSRRFGTVQPLPERESGPTGSDFIRAMTGLYGRAKASSPALQSVYSSFRREINTSFGVPVDASPSDAAEAILRARQVDKAKLAALLSKCEASVAKWRVPEADAVALAKAIEDTRRELGIERNQSNTGS